MSPVPGMRLTTYSPCLAMYISTPPRTHMQRGRSELSYTLDNASLQARVGRQQRDAPDEVLRCVHGNLLGVCGHDRAYTIS